MTDPEITLVVIAKAPVAGKVKTRLCPPCTPREAAMLAEAALADTLTAVAVAPACRRVLALDGAPGPWLPPGFDVVTQRGSGLDQRLVAAFADAGGPALLVGMDTPQLTPDLIAACVADLRCPGVDAVLGPAVDGGWWAIGLRRPDRRVFVDVPMSTPESRRVQLARLSELELTTRIAPVLRDVDTFADARPVAEAAPTTRFAAALAELGART